MYKQIFKHKVLFQINLFIVLVVGSYACNNDQSYKTERIISNPELNNILEKYISETRFSENSEKKKPIFTLSLQGDTSNARIVFHASKYMLGTSIDHHELKGVADCDEFFLAIFDYDKGVFRNWYNQNALSQSIISQLESTELKRDFILPPYWIYGYSNQNFKLIEIGDTIKLL